MSDFEPEGPFVSSILAESPSLKPSDFIRTELSGLKSSIYLVPLTIDHTSNLYAHLGGLQNAHLYKYMTSGPFNDLESFTAMIKFLLDSTLFSSFAIKVLEDFRSSRHDGTMKNNPLPGTAIGIICLLNINPLNRTIEIGHVLFGPALQRTTAATEAFYLLMRYCFEDLHYLRVEWKANDRNEPSKRAAERLGFVFEGVFRKHMIVKGRRRDSAWFSVVDEEWFEEGQEVGSGSNRKGVKVALEGWLEKENFDAHGKQKRRLEQFRKVEGSETGKSNAG